jgi:Zn-dependent peptidase ImmA (M78 family)
MLSPANCAKDFRSELGLKDDDVVDDIISLITDTAGYEYEEQFDDDPYYGFSEYKGSGMFKICYNRRYNWNIAFKRFTLAHELGHISLHHDYLREHVLHRCYTAEQFIKNLEIEADIFAANFLAPSNAVLKLIRDLDFTPNSISTVASHFNISTYAAALRFIELTEKTCSFIVSNKAFQTEYERRSSKFNSRFKHPFVYKTKIHSKTLTYYFVNGKRNINCCDSLMSYWYPGLESGARIKEFVIDLGYNDKFMTLISPIL